MSKKKNLRTYRLSFFISPEVEDKTSFHQTRPRDFKLEDSTHEIQFFVLVLTGKRGELRARKLISKENFIILLRGKSHYEWYF